MMGGRRKGRGTRVPPITPPGGSGRKADDGEGRAPKGGGGGGTVGGGGGAGLAPFSVSELTPLSTTGERGRLPSPLPPPSSGSSLAATSRPTAPSEKAARSVRTGSLRRRPLDGKWDRVSVTLGGRAGGGRRGRPSLKAKAAVRAVVKPLVAERGAKNSTELVFSGESNLAPDSCPALVLNADYQVCMSGGSAREDDDVQGEGRCCSRWAVSDERDWIAVTLELTDWLCGRGVGALGRIIFGLLCCSVLGCACLFLLLAACFFVSAIYPCPICITAIVLPSVVTVAVARSHQGGVSRPCAGGCRVPQRVCSVARAPV